MPQEIKIEWDKIEEEQKKYFVSLYSKLLKTKKRNTVKRIFELGHPQIVMGRNETGAYARVAEESVPLIQLLAKEYL